MTVVDIASPARSAGDRGVEVYHERRAEPGDDLASVLATASVDGHEMTVEAFASFFMLLVDAGGDTTRNLVGGGIEQLLARPEQLAWLLEDFDARLPAAVEELLRFCSPVVHMGRQAVADLELAGPVARLESAFISGPRAMPVRFTPAAAGVER